MPQMTDAQRRAFLSDEAHTGVLATVRADGRPHAAPVWFVPDGDDVVFMTGAETAKGRNLRRDPRAVMSVDDEVFPFAFVLLDGRCMLDDAADDLLDWSRRIAARYVPADQVEAFAARNAVPGELLVRLVPDKVIAERDVAG